MVKLAEVEQGSKKRKQSDIEADGGTLTKQVAKQQKVPISGMLDQFFQSIGIRTKVQPRKSVFGKINADDLSQELIASFENQFAGRLHHDSDAPIYTNVLNDVAKYVCASAEVNTMWVKREGLGFQYKSKHDQKSITLTRQELESELAKLEGDIVAPFGDPKKDINVGRNLLTCGVAIVAGKKGSTQPKEVAFCAVGWDAKEGKMALSTQYERKPTLVLLSGWGQKTTQTDNNKMRAYLDKNNFMRNNNASGPMKSKGSTCSAFATTPHAQNYYVCCGETIVKDMSLLDTHAQATINTCNNIYGAGGDWKFRTDDMGYYHTETWLLVALKQNPELFVNVINEFNEANAHKQFDKIYSIVILVHSLKACCPNCRRQFMASHSLSEINDAFVDAGYAIPGNIGSGIRIVPVANVDLEFNNDHHDMVPPDQQVSGVFNIKAINYGKRLIEYFNRQ